jgi:hypothetical protein
VGLYHGDKPLRLYEALIERAYLLTVGYDDEGHRIDQREEIELP